MIFVIEYYLEYITKIKYYQSAVVEYINIRKNLAPFNPGKAWSAISKDKLVAFSLLDFFIPPQNGRDDRK
jgi:hypothetical protein